MHKKNISDIIIVSFVLVLVVIVILASILELVAQLLLLHDLSHIIDWLSSYGGSARGGVYYSKGFGILLFAIIYLSILIYLVKTLNRLIKHYKLDNDMTINQDKNIK